MDVETANRASTRTGLITLPIGLALVAAPAGVGRPLGSGNYNAALRVIGGLDLALVPGLLVGDRPGRWLTARAGLNLAIAGYCVMVGRDGGDGAKVIATALVAATVADGQAIAALRRQ